jgi:hypothetical protein
MKVALCFIISYKQEVTKEELWKQWITSNKDIINVYFHYKNYETIKSSWIKKHALPQQYICPTDYAHIVPAYMSLMKYAMNHDTCNEWFCFLTEACVPIISPSRFRRLFFDNYSFTVMNWKPIWWNVRFCNRANLHLLSPEFHLGNDPWFILNKKDAKRCLIYSVINHKVFKLICDGNIANESIFAIILLAVRSLQTNMVLKEITHITDWSRMSSQTSPYVFREENLQKNIEYIKNSINDNKYAIFLRKIDKTFPDHVLSEFIADTNTNTDTDAVTVAVAVAILKEKSIVIQYYIYKYWYFIIPTCILVVSSTIYSFLA